MWYISDHRMYHTTSSRKTATINRDTFNSTILLNMTEEIQKRDMETLPGAMNGQQISEGRGGPKGKRKQCEHNKRYDSCRICNPSLLCEHNKVRNGCVRCRKAAGKPKWARAQRRSYNKRCYIHGNPVKGIIKPYCRGCHGSALCFKHGLGDGSIRKGSCKECREAAGKPQKVNNNKRCYIHGNSVEGTRTTYCKGCRGTSLCWLHGSKDGSVLKNVCRECHGKSLCWIHGLCDGTKLKQNCFECHGSALCWDHCNGTKRKLYCKQCGGKYLCIKCQIWTVPKTGGQCATCRTPGWQGKIKEKVVGLQLLQWASDGKIPLFTLADKTIPGSGLRYRVDFSYDLASHFTCLELDEHQHTLRGYAPRCELVRMYRIAIAINKPVIFLRHNPDSFKIGDVTEHVPKAEREALLLAVLQEHLQTVPTAFLTLVYICYSQPSKQMHGQQRAYVTTQKFETEVDFEEYVGSVYPNDCAATPAGTPWYTKN